jgi:hypothetical protein
MLIRTIFLLFVLSVICVLFSSVTFESVRLLLFVFVFCAIPILSMSFCSRDYDQ